MNDFEGSKQGLNGAKVGRWKTIKKKRENNKTQGTEQEEDGKARRRGQGGKEQGNQKENNSRGSLNKTQEEGKKLK